jgi:amidohydrolase
MFKVEVTGLASHGAVREKGIDALAAAAEMVTALLELPSKITSDKCILTVGRMQSGTAGNIMPGEAVFEGIIRTLGPETRRRMEEEFRNTVQAIADRTGTAADIDYIHSHPGVVNDKSMTDLAFRAACGMFGEEKVHIIEEPVMISEDFGCFLDKAHGSFYHIGAGCALPLHNPAFLPEEDVVTELAVMHAGMVWSYLME